MTGPGAQKTQPTIWLPYGRSTSENTPWQRAAVRGESTTRASCFSSSCQLKAVLVNARMPRMGTQLASGWERWERNRKRVLIAKISGFFCCGISGIIPWNAVPGKACGPILENICNTNEVQTHNLHAAFASKSLGHRIINNLMKVLGENWC